MSNPTTGKDRMFRDLVEGAVAARRIAVAERRVTAQIALIVELHRDGKDIGPAVARLGTLVQAVDKQRYRRPASATRSYPLPHASTTILHSSSGRIDFATTLLRATAAIRAWVAASIRPAKKTI
jgi:hypothetical protein